MVRGPLTLKAVLPQSQWEVCDSPHPWLRPREGSIRASSLGRPLTMGFSTSHFISAAGLEEAGPSNLAPSHDLS